MYLTIPYRMLKGEGEKIDQLPYTRTLKAVSAGLGIETRKLLHWETFMRHKLNLPEYGQYGNYYIDRQLRNMAGDDPSLLDEVRRAMIERKGPLFDEAKRRVDLEMMARTPGAAALYGGMQAAQGEASWADTIGAAMFSWLPAGMLPTGELKLRGLYDEYEQARSQYNQGDREALTKFYDKHPEYAAEISLKLSGDPDTSFPHRAGNPSPQERA